MGDYNTDEKQDSQMSQWYGVREATLFLVDATSGMFKVDPETNLSHLQTFLKLYKQILRQKLAWNMKDWMGVVLFGTEENDAGSQWKHIQTLQELKIVTLNELLHIRKLRKCGVEGYQSMKSDAVYPLHDALSYAMDTFLKINTVLTKRRIVLVTCHNPILESDEKHRIRLKATSLKDMDIKLHVIGLGSKWVHDQFYKDLEMLSRKTDVDVYRITSLDDLIQQIQAPSKNIARLCFKISNGLELDLAVRTIGRKSRSLPKKTLSKATNQILIKSTYYKDNDDNDSNDEDNNDEETNVPCVIPEEINLKTKEPVGGRTLYFTRKEYSELKRINPPSINLITVKPVPNDLFQYHVKRNYFVRADYNSTRKDNLLFFAALLNKCASGGKMLVCAFTLRKNTQTELCYMIPNAELGGFYLSKVAYKGNVTDKSKMLHYYKTQDQVTGKEVVLWEKVIDKLNMKYRPSMFKSYKLECLIQMVESLALDKESGPPPIDTIKQSYQETCEKVRELIPELKNMYFDSGPSKAKKPRKSKATS